MANHGCFTKFLSTFVALLLCQSNLSKSIALFILEDIMLYPRLKSATYHYLALIAS
jgi:hypothetical protein